MVLDIRVRKKSWWVWFRLEREWKLENESASGMIDHAAQMGKSGLWQVVTTSDMEIHAHLQGDNSHRRMANNDFLYGENDRNDVHDMETDTSSISSGRHCVDDDSFTDMADGRDAAVPRPKATLVVDCHANLFRSSKWGQSLRAQSNWGHMRSKSRWREDSGR